MKKIFLSLFLLFFVFSAFSKSDTGIIAVYKPSFVDIDDYRLLSSSKIICEKLKSSVEECFDSFDEVVIILDKDELKLNQKSLKAIIITKFINENNEYYIKSGFVDIKSKNIIAETKSDIMPDSEVLSDSKETLINQVISRLSEKYYSTEKKFELSENKTVDSENISISNNISDKNETSSVIKTEKDVESKTNVESKTDVESEFDIDDYITEEKFPPFCHLGFTSNLDCNFGADLDFHFPIDDSLFFYLDLGLMPRISEVYDKTSNWVLYPDILLGAGLNKSFSSINVYGLLAVGILGCGTDYFDLILELLFNGKDDEEDSKKKKNNEEEKERYRDIGFDFRVAIGLDYKISEKLALYAQYNFDTLCGVKDYKDDYYLAHSNVFTLGLGFLY